MHILSCALSGNHPNLDIQERFIEWVNEHQNVHWVPFIEMAEDFKAKHPFVTEGPKKIITDDTKSPQITIEIQNKAATKDTTGAPAKEKPGTNGTSNPLSG
jgi:hypothetical protein